MKIFVTCNHKKQTYLSGEKEVALILLLCYREFSKSVFYGSQAAVFRGILRMIPLLIFHMNRQGQCGSF
jgi:hypothetical protein